MKIRFSSLRGNVLVQASGLFCQARFRICRRDLGRSFFTETARSSELMHKTLVQRLSTVHDQATAVECTSFSF